MAKNDLPAHVRALTRAEAFPHNAEKVEFIPTTISYVYLVGEDVYKLRRPIDLGYLDFTTLEKRRVDCEAEVRLNARGCPGLHLGVEPVVRRGQDYGLGGEGEIVDYAVHMKRLSTEGMMDLMLERDAVTFEMIGRLVARVVKMHQDADRNDHISQVAREGMSTNWRENFEQLAPFVGRTLSQARFDRIKRFVDSFFQDEAAIMHRRIDEGWVRECHGDLRSDAVAFDRVTPGGVCLYDCIEFNERFRFIDTAMDVGFMAMDLDYRGRPDYSDLFIGLYTAAMGDRELPLLLDFCKSYRAVVRGKVESMLLSHDDVSRDKKTAAARRARRYFRLAESYARRPELSAGIVLVMGPSGSGKSVLAGCLAARCDAVLLSTDMLRRSSGAQADALPGAGIRQKPQREALDAGKYTEAARLQVYEDLAQLARKYCESGRRVVVDGTFIEKRQRALVIEAARAAGRSLFVVECWAPDAAVEQRQKQREGEDWTTSEGRFEVYLAQKERLEPPAELPDAQRMTVDTTTDLGLQIEAVMARLGRPKSRRKPQRA